MSSIEFTKMHGTGNDFIVIDGINNDLSAVNMPQFAIKVCDRHFGVGADGIILVLPSQKADYTMTVFNSDGSEPEMCGNGIRCFTRYLYEKLGEKKEVVSVETLAGIMVPTAVIENGVFTGVEVDMGAPRIESINEGLNVDGEDFKINKISMGNPHCVIFVEDLGLINIEEIGPVIENLPQFPNRTNVEFAQIINKEEIELKVWERGAGATLACGTGACATAVAAISNALTGKKVFVHLPGGDLAVEWDLLGHVIMSGPAEKVFEGSIII